MLRLGSPVRIGEEHEATFALRNFHPAEDGFAWSAGRWCEIEFAWEPAGRPRQLLLELDVNAFRDAHLLPAPDLFVYLNGLRIGSLTLPMRQLAAFPIAATLLQPDRNVLVLDAPDAARPIEFGREDGRLLGVQLFSLAVVADQDG